MTKEEAEKSIRYLAHQWAGEQTPADLARPSFSTFRYWVHAKGYSRCLRFKVDADPDYIAEIWFHSELRQN